MSTVKQPARGPHPNLQAHLIEIADDECIYDYSDAHAVRSAAKVIDHLIEMNESLASGLKKVRRALIMGGPVGIGGAINMINELLAENEDDESPDTTANDG